MFPDLFEEGGFDLDRFEDAELCYDRPEQSGGEASADSSDEALMVCLDRYGVVDLLWMEQLSGICVEQLILDLDGSAIFQDPAAFETADRWNSLDGWITAPQYLSGDLARKLELARQVRARFPGRFATNIDALEKRLPQRLTMEDIHVSLGAAWVPADIYSEFLTGLLGLRKRLPVFWNPELAKWRIESSQEASRSILNNYTYGTAQMSGVKITEATMNARTVKIYKSRPPLQNGVDRTLDLEATMEAQEKQRKIIEAFSLWVVADPQRKQRLEEAYNDTFVGHFYSPYDGSFLRLRDLRPEVTLYPHQRDAVARILLSRENVLLCHDVGAGKTYEIVVGIHELKRMGKSRKNLVVVPNNVLNAVVQTHRYLYPDDRIQAIFPGDFTVGKRTRILEELRDGDFVATYMACSSFDLIHMSCQYQAEQLEDKIRSLRDAADMTLRKEERRMLRNQADSLARKLADFRKDATDTPWPCFDTLGIETLIVDEAHNYKNIPYDSSADNIVGRASGGSAKCKQMLAKCHSVDRVIFATGTPLTNSISDLFVLMTYLQPGELKFRRIDSFDMWINTFAERVTDYEIDVDGSRLRLMTRFNSFRNLTELMSLFCSVCDLHHMDRRDGELPQSDGYRDILVPRNGLQSAYIKELAERTERIRTGKVPVTEDNLLKITTDGRKCALDIRLVMDEVPVEQPESSKLHACAREVHRLYREEPGTCQIVFCDIGTPKAGFNVYDALRDCLVGLGIPYGQIAFVHDADSEAKRARLFAQMNAGEVRVAVGSTAKLGVGVNVQDRLVAVHHLSIPWKPSDITQREGRILRRGNTCKKVYLYRYITEGTFDAYSWQLLQNKQHFISSFLSGTAVARDAPDIMDAVLSYAEVKALAVGDPLIRQRCQTANRLERCKIAARARQKRAVDLQAVLEKAPEQIRRLKTLCATAGKDLEHYRSHRTSVSKQERQAFGEDLLEAIRDNVSQARERLFDTYQGFDVLLPAMMTPEYPHVYLTSPYGGRYLVELDGRSPYGCTRKLDTVLSQLEQRREKLEQQLRQAHIRRDQARTELSAEDPMEAQIRDLTALLEDIDRQLKEKEENG